MSLEDKLKKLKIRLKGLGSVLVAYSGGVDSTLLLKVATTVLKDRVLAVTAQSETYPAIELVSAENFAKRLGIRHKIIKTKELLNPYFRSNPKQRCYYCKRELFERLKRLASRQRLKFVIDGSNIDDISDYRPGTRAKKELGIISPLQEAGLTKREIRQLSKKLRLLTWSKPANVCLASRIPYNSTISRKRLQRIDRAEELLRRTFSLKGNLRVRDFGDEARIEVDKGRIANFASSKRLTILLEGLGYKNIVVDPTGYRSGSLNEQIIRPR